MEIESLDSVSGVGMGAGADNDSSGSAESCHATAVSVREDKTGSTATTILGSPKEAKLQ